MKVKDGLLSKDFDNINILNIVLYSVIVFMPFIVTTIVKPYYVSGKVIYLYLLFFVILFLLVKLKIRINFNIEEILVFIFWGSLLLATVVSIDLSVAIMGNKYRYEGLLAYIIYILLFMSSLYFIKVYKYISHILCISGTIMSIYAVFQYYGIDPLRIRMFDGEKSIDMVATIGNRNFLSSYLLLFLILSIGIYIFKNKKIFSMYSSIIFAGVLATYTRSGWLSLVICCIIGLSFVFRNKDRMKRSLIIVMIFFVVFSVMEVTGKGGFIFRAKSIVEDAIDKSEESGSGRLLIWSITMDAIKKNPIIGTGLDTLQSRLLKDNFEGYTYYVNTKKAGIDKAHNEFLEYWACGGILTLISYVALIGVILTKLFKSREDDGCKIYFLMILGYVIQSFFNISVIGVAPLYWILLGAAVKYYRDLDKAKAVQAIAD